MMPLGDRRRRAGDLGPVQTPWWCHVCIHQIFRESDSSACVLVNAQLDLYLHSFLIFWNRVGSTFLSAPAWAASGDLSHPPHKSSQLLRNAALATVREAWFWRNSRTLNSHARCVWMREKIFFWLACCLLARLLHCFFFCGRFHS